MLVEHQTTAKASGARLVFSCGFNSIPFDLGVLLRRGGCQSALWRPTRPASAAGFGR